MKLAKSKDEIWMITDRSQVPDLVTACLEAASQVSTILIREKDWSLEETSAFCQRLLKGYEKDLILNWNGGFDPSSLPLQGVHLSFDMAYGWACSPSEGPTLLKQKKPLWKIGASVHSEKEWEALKGLPLDYVLLSNVFATTCKPHKAGLGLLETERLCKVIQKDAPSTQVYGLGGLKMADLEKITALGLQGIALRSAFF